MFLIGLSVPQPEIPKEWTTAPKVFYLSGPLNTEQAVYVTDWLQSVGPHPVILINSLGGDLEASVKIASAISAKGDVTCVVRGRAASGAFAVLQACVYRVMTMSSTLGTHEPSRMLSGLFNRQDLLKGLTELIGMAEAWNAICRRKLKLLPDEYTARVYGRDWNMTAAEALEVGAVDRVF